MSKPARLELNCPTHPRQNVRFTAEEQLTQPLVCLDGCVTIQQQKQDGVCPATYVFSTQRLLFPTYLILSNTCPSVKLRDPHQYCFKRPSCNTSHMDDDLRSMIKLENSQDMCVDELLESPSQPSAADPVNQCWISRNHTGTPS